MTFSSAQVFLCLGLQLLFHETISASPTKHCSNKGNVQRCHYQYLSRILRCDGRSRNSLPSPTELQGPAPPSTALSIYINSSCLQEIDSGQLRQYTHAKQLNYDDNMIQTIPKSCFSHLHLEELILSRNSISTINSAFNGLSHLKTLHLNGNQLQEILDDHFSELLSLTSLDLSDNMLTYVHRNAFEGLTSLTSLDLSNNRLTKFEPGHLSGLVNLNKLRLRSNHLQSLDSHLLVSSPHLEVVDLSFNRLQCLPANLFDNQSDLKSVLLMSNQLRTPHPDWFRSIVANGRMPDVNLMQNNKWLCDCHSISYRNFLLNEITEHEDQWIDKLDVRCFQPATNEGKYLSDVKHFGSNCPYPLEPLECEQQESSTRTTTTNVPRPTTTTTTTKSTTTEKSTTIKAKINSRSQVTTTITLPVNTPLVLNLGADLPTKEDKSPLMIIIISLVAVLCFAILGMAVYCMRRKWKKEKLVKKQNNNRMTNKDDEAGQNLYEEPEIKMDDQTIDNQTGPKLLYSASSLSLNEIEPQLYQAGEIPNPTNRKYRKRTDSG
uniref:LRRCT domain-containing protein n=2 Tax=Ciona intestinalis TaxID=7719 RepID=F7A7U9_CIOIN